MIPEAFVQDLLARVDVVDVVGRYVQLRKGGANLLGLCPFHNEKSPSFTVSPTKQFYHCFGCGAHGTAITFLMAHTGASFPEAVRSLAANVGMTVPEADRSPRQRAADQRRKEERSRHQQALDAAQAHYAQALARAPAAQAYLTRRGLKQDTVAAFGLGWAAPERRGLAAVFPRYEDPLLVEAGLVVESEDGRRHDRFRDRLMFPIRNTRGQLIGFGGRVLDKGTPKYLNSPETPLFSKGLELYGLWEARMGIRQAGSVLVVEGYMDVVGLAQHGVSNAVATLGTATTPDHVQKLLRASQRIVFCFDGDGAGRRAAWRALTTCLPFAKDDISLRFLFLPPEHDPDSYVAAYGPEAFRAAMQEALPLSRFLLEELAGRHRLDEPEGRAAFVHEAHPLLAQLPEGALRLQIEHEAARQARLTPEEFAAVRLQMRGPPTRGPAPHEAPPPSAAAASRAAPPSAAPEFTPDPVMHDPGMRAPDEVPPWLDAEPEPPSRGLPARASAPARKTPRRSARTVTSLARRLLRLLLGHPTLATRLGDQQLEILTHSPQLVLVCELIVLINTSAAAHTGALRAAVEPGTDLAELIEELAADVLDDELPNPEAEWQDALLRIELDAIKEEQSALAAEGLSTPQARARYQELSRRLGLLARADLRKLK